MPTQPLCQADCAGLCPTCGTNRNTTACGCETADAYRPFAALAELVARAS
ncbi:MAG TPA: YceD family protein [Chloroflexota bacterium]|nr:YceD family protein [Chloroflexota bacterium]